MYRSNIKDFLNQDKERNIKNTDKGSYNCGGYALGTFSWYVPYSKRDTWVYPIPLEKLIEQMLKDFPNLRMIDNINEVQKNEYAIAFRKGDGDFHYMKKAKNGRWYNKRGCSYKIETLTQEEVLDKNWYNWYDEPITLFAMREVA